MQHTICKTNKILRIQLEQITSTRNWSSGQITLKVIDSPNRGKGVAVNLSFSKGQFICPYVGDIHRTNDQTWKETVEDYNHFHVGSYVLDILKLYKGE